MRNIHAIIGLLIPIVFLGGYILFFFVLYPEVLESMKGLPLTSYYVEDIERFAFMRWYYLILGSMQVLFCGGLFFWFDKKISTIIGITALIISGIIWMSHGIWGMVHAELEGWGTSLLLVRLFMYFLITALGFLFLSNYARTTFRSNFFRLLFWGLGILLLIGMFFYFHFALMKEAPSSVEIIPWLIINLTYGLMGYRLFYLVHLDSN